MDHADDLPTALSDYLRQDPMAAHLGIAVDVIRPRYTEFLSAATVGEVLICEAVELSRTHRMAVYRMTVSTEAEQRPVAEMLARVYRRDVELP